MTDDPRTASLEAVFDALGWEITDAFVREYQTNALVYNLANALVDLWNEAR